MGDFRKFIENDISEARFRAAGGAFGGGGGSAFDFSRSAKGDRMNPFSMDRRSANQFQNIDSRVATGKAMEEKIIGALREAGWTVNPPKPNQDKYGKIDGWVERGGKWLPLQIKYRDSGDEIAMETILDFHPDQFHGSLMFNGRDMVGGAKIYACLNKAGNVIRVCDTDEAKAAAQEAVRLLSKEFNATGKRVASTPKAEARITGDPASGRSKVMAFVKPGALSSIQNVKVAGDRSLWAA
jgi:hypothetical protein